MGPTVSIRQRLLGMRVDAGADTGTIAEMIVQWARGRRSGYVCPLTVGSLLQGSRDISFRRILNSADATPCVDRQLAWWLGQHRHYSAEPGQAFLIDLCTRAEALEISVGLYGLPGAARDRASAFLRDRFPALRVVSTLPDAITRPTLAQDMAITRALNASGPRLLLVCLGSPLEEEWMLNHKGRLHAVMVGASSLVPPRAVGGASNSGDAMAFAGSAGLVTRASGRLPRWESLRLAGRILREAWGRAQGQVGRAHLAGAGRIRR